MKNQTIPINSSRIKICEYENCKNQFIRRSNNHKYCKEHEKINNRKDKLKTTKKRKYRDENDSTYNNIVSEDDNSITNDKVIKKENKESVTVPEQNTPVSNSKKPNLLDILMKRTNSTSYNCIGKNKPFHINNVPQKVDKCIQTDDLFEFIPKVKKPKVDKCVGTENDVAIESTSPLLDVLTAPQFTGILDTPTKNIQSINSPISTKRSLKGSMDYPLRDISNLVNTKYLKSPISDRKSPKFLTKSYNRLSEFENKNKENFNFNVTPIKRELNDDTSYKSTTDSLSYLLPGEDNLFTVRDRDIYSQPLNNINGINIVNDGNGNGNGNGSGSGSGIDGESTSNPQHTLPVDYYMEYIKILKKISKFSPSQELKQTLSSNSNLNSINNHNILSPAKTDAEELLNWLNIE